MAAKVTIPDPGDDFVEYMIPRVFDSGSDKYSPEYNGLEDTARYLQNKFKVPEAQARKIAPQYYASGLQKAVKKRVALYDQGKLHPDEARDYLGALRRANVSIKDVGQATGLLKGVGVSSDYLKDSKYLGLASAGMDLAPAPVPPAPQRPAAPPAESAKGAKEEPKPSAVEPEIIPVKKVSAGTVARDVADAVTPEVLEGTGLGYLGAAALTSRKGKYGMPAGKYFRQLKEEGRKFSEGRPRQRIEKEYLGKEAVAKTAEEAAEKAKREALEKYGSARREYAQTKRWAQSPADGGPSKVSPQLPQQYRSAKTNPPRDRKVDDAKKAVRSAMEEYRAAKETAQKAPEATQEAKRATQAAVRDADLLKASRTKAEKGVAKGLETVEKVPGKRFAKGAAKVAGKFAAPVELAVGVGQTAKAFTDEDYREQKLREMEKMGPVGRALNADLGTVASMGYALTESVMDAKRAEANLKASEQRFSRMNFEREKYDKQQGIPIDEKTTDEINENAEYLRGLRDTSRNPKVSEEERQKARDILRRRQAYMYDVARNIQLGSPR